MKRLFRPRIKEDILYRYRIIPPSLKKSGSGNHQKFRVQKWTYNEDRSKVLESESIHDEAVEAINSAYQTKKMDIEKAREQLELHVEKLYKDAGALSAVVFASDNLKAMATYFEKNYPKSRKDRIDFRPAESETRRAIEALENVSIYGPLEDIQEQIDTVVEGDSVRQRRVVSKLNAIMKIVRPDGSKLIRWPEEQKGMVSHLTDEDFKIVLEHLPKGHMQVLAKVCFYIGCRVGEAMALTPGDLMEKSQQVVINKQIVREDHEKRKVKHKTKNRKLRRAFIFKEGLEALKEWFKVKHKLTLPERNELALNLRRAQIIAFPKDEDLRVTRWHDLRHSYAIKLLSKQLPLDWVARMIGDSPRVCEKYYLGYILNDAMMDTIRKAANSD